MVKHKVREQLEEISKLAPAINRLELSAATMLVSMAKTISEVTEIPIPEMFFWTDSENVLRQINRGGKNCFISKHNVKKVDHILEYTTPDQWRHVPGEENPADLASRGVTGEAFVKANLWHEGPDWLPQGQRRWPEQKPELKFQGDNPDDQDLLLSIAFMQEDQRGDNDLPDDLADDDTLEQDVPLVQSSGGGPDAESRRRPKLPHLDLTAETWLESLQLAEDFIQNQEGQPWEDLRNLLAQPSRKQEILELVVVWEAQRKWASELLKVLKKKRIPRKFQNMVCERNLQIRNIQGLEVIISLKRGLSRTWRKLQEQARRANLPHGKQARRWHKKNQVVDANELVQSEYTVFVPWETPTARRIVRHIHTGTGHGSFPAVEASVKQKWSIPKLTKLYSAVRRKCTECCLIDAQTFTLPEGRLNPDRIMSQRPFEVCGLDFIGPLEVWSDSSLPDPLILMFTCPYTRAVSLHPVRSKKWSEFKHAYTMFVLQKQLKPAHIRSDNACTFEAAENRLRAMEELHPTKWTFNPTYAAWWGGFYERLIRFLKRKIALCFNRQKFFSWQDFEEAVAFLEGLLNNRPIYVCKERDGTNYVTIRPAQFIFSGHPDNFQQNMENMFQTLEQDSMPGMYMASRIKRQNHFFLRLKNVFEQNYLNNLRNQHSNKMYSKFGASIPTVQVGDSVLVNPGTRYKKTSPLTRLKWEVGTVTKIYPNRDNEVRKVDVQYIDSKTGKLKERIETAIQNFAPIEVNAEEMRKKFEENAKIPPEATRIL